MIDSFLRKPYQNILVDPVAEHLSKYSLNPNTITLFAFITGVAVCPLLYFKLSLLALFSMLFSGYLDSLDGSVARALRLSTPKGTVFDIVSDRLVEFAIIFGLFLYNPVERASLTLLMLGASFICVTSFLVVGIFVPNTGKKGFHYSPGLIERGEAFVLFAMMIAFPLAFTPLASLFTVLVFLTAFIRVFEFAAQS